MMNTWKKCTLSLYQDIKARHGISQLDQESVQDLRAACELTKRKLSSLPEASAKLFFSRHSTHYTASMTRARFEDLCGDLFRKTMDITERVLSAAKVRPDAIRTIKELTRLTNLCSLRSLKYLKSLRLYQVREIHNSHFTHRARGEAGIGTPPHPSPYLWSVKCEDSYLDLALRRGYTLKFENAHSCTFNFALSFLHFS